MSSSREGVLLRAGAAERAVPYRERAAAQQAAQSQQSEQPHQPVVPPQAAVPQAERIQPEPVIERRTTIRRAADQVVGAGTGFRLGDVYAEELQRLRQHAHAEGYTAGHAEGMAAAAAAIAETQRQAAERLTEVQARWERRVASATAALGAAAARFDEAAQPVAEEVRETILGTVLTLVEDLLGRELALAADPVMDAVRRALALVPSDAPAVVRVHPDDLAEIPEESLAGLPDNVRMVADLGIERAGAVVETGPRRIDAQLGAALERVQAVLSS